MEKSRPELQLLIPDQPATLRPQDQLIETRSERTSSVSS